MELLSEDNYFLDIANTIYHLGYLHRIEEDQRPVLKIFEKERSYINREYKENLEKINSILIDDKSAMEIITQKQNLKNAKFKKLKELYKLIPIKHQEIFNKATKLTKENATYLTTKTQNLFNYKKSTAFNKGFHNQIQYDQDSGYPNFVPLDITFDFYPLEKRQQVGLISSEQTWCGKNDEGKIISINKKLSDKSPIKYLKQQDIIGTIYKEIYASDFDFVVEGKHLTTDWQKYILSMLPQYLLKSYITKANIFNKQQGLPLLDLEDISYNKKF